MSTIKTDTLQNVAGTLSVPVATVVNGSAKAWVNFNGTGTVAIRAAFNVSSITDNGTGDYTVNFTNAMSDAYYADSLSVQVASGTFFRSAYVTDTGKLVGSLRFVTVNSSNVNADFPGVNVAIFR